VARTVRQRIIKTQAAAEYRAAARAIANVAARSVGIERLRWPVEIVYRFYLARRLPPDGRYRPRDVGNAISAMKAAQDGFLIDTGLLPDDDARHVIGYTVYLHSGKQAAKRAEVEVELVPCSHNGRG